MQTLETHAPSGTLTALPVEKQLQTRGTTRSTASSSPLVLATQRVKREGGRAVVWLPCSACCKPCGRRLAPGLLRGVRLQARDSRTARLLPSSTKLGPASPRACWWHGPRGAAEMRADSRFIGSAAAALPGATQSCFAPRSGSRGSSEHRCSTKLYLQPRRTMKRYGHEKLCMAEHRCSTKLYLQPRKRARARQSFH